MLSFMSVFLGRVHGMVSLWGLECDLSMSYSTYGMIVSYDAWI